MIKPALDHHVSRSNVATRTGHLDHVYFWINDIQILYRQTWGPICNFVTGEPTTAKQTQCIISFPGNMLGVYVREHDSRFNQMFINVSGMELRLSFKHFTLDIDRFDFIKCFTTTFLRAHSWLNWVDEDDDENEVGLKEKPETLDTSKRLHRNRTRSTGSVDKGLN